MPSISVASGMVEVFDETTDPLARTASILRYRSCLISRRSMTASTIQSHLASLSRSSSILPHVISFATRLDMNGAGSVFSILATAPSATALRFSDPSGTISSNRTGVPELAIWAAIPAPITPAPITATCLMLVITSPPEWSRSPDPRQYIARQVRICRLHVSEGRLPCQQYVRPLRPADARWPAHHRRY